jgi:hypothetical protein
MSMLEISKCGKVSPILKSILNTLKRLAAQLGFSGRLIATKLSQDGSEAIRDCRDSEAFANADYNPSEKLAFSNRGRSRQNEEGNLAVGAALIEKPNSLGAKWGPPVWCNEQGVDCFSQDQSEKLSIQITKISPGGYFKNLNERGSASHEQHIEQAMWDIMEAVRRKAGQASPQIVLALDATDTPVYTMSAVLDALRSKQEAELRGSRWQAIWLVGAEPTLTSRLDGNNRTR